MKIFIKAKPGSRKEYVKRIDDTHFVVALKEPPVRGTANRAIIEALAKYFDKPKYQIYIVSGETSKQKVIEIPVTIDKLQVKNSQKKLF